MLIVDGVAAEHRQQLQFSLQLLLPAEIDRYDGSRRLKVLVAQSVDRQVQQVVLLELELHRVHPNKLVQAIEEEDKDHGTFFVVDYVLPIDHLRLRGTNLSTDEFALSNLAIPG